MADTLNVPSVDPQAALGAMRIVADEIAKPATRRRFEAQATAGEIDIRLVDRYPALAEVAAGAVTGYQAEWEREGDALVPMVTVSQGIALKERMFKVLEYYLGDVASVREQLEAIRSGTGYRDLASDLGSLAQLEAEHRATIQGDAKHYRATDSADALTCAAEIQRARSGGAPTQKAAKAWARAFHDIRAVHEAILEVGRFLERKSGDPNGRYPSLFVAAKKTPPKKKPKKDETK